MDEMELENMRKITKLALMRIGIRCDFVAFKLLIYAVELVSQDMELAYNLCKKLYVKIGDYFNIKVHCVERNIRNAIEQAYSNGSLFELNELFGAEIVLETEKLTSGELIMLLSEYYVLGVYKNVEKKDKLKAEESGK